MTKSISNDMQTHLDGDVTNLCTCWRVIREDGVEMGFTDHDADLTVDALLYKATTGFTATAIQSKSDFSVDNLDLDGMLSSDDLKETEILNGSYDYAEIEIFMVNYEDLTQGKIFLKRGRLGEVRVKRSKFVVELRGLSQHLQQHIGRVFAPSCDAVFGDARCGIDIADHTYPVIVDTVTHNASFFTTTSSGSASLFVGGEIHWLTGNNAGLKMEVKTFVDTKVELALPMCFSIQAGDTANIIAGCDKTFPTCRDRFSNAVNFRGFHQIPGMDAIFQTAGTTENLRQG